MEKLYVQNRFQIMAVMMLDISISNYMMYSTSFFILHRYIPIYITTHRYTFMAGKKYLLVIS